MAAAEESFDMARERAEVAEQAKATAEAAQARLRDVQQAADGARAKLKAEVSALAELLESGSGDLFPPLIDAVTVAPDYEVAIAAALGDDLTAPLDEAAAVHWRTLPDLDGVVPLPFGTEPLASKITAPPALKRCLGHIGVVSDTEQGDALAALLKPGQVLVTRDGASWRWDGLSVMAGAPTAAAIRLKQRNRLAELRLELDAAEDNAAEAREASDAARAEAAEAAAQERRCRDAVRDAFGAVGRTRDHYAKLAQANAATASRLAALIEAVERLEADKARRKLKSRRPMPLWKHCPKPEKRASASPSFAPTWRNGAASWPAVRTPWTACSGKPRDGVSALALSRQSSAAGPTAPPEPTNGLPS